MRLRSLLVLSLCTTVCQARNLGSYGQTFEIKETNFLHVIEARLKQLEAGGKIKEHQKEVQQKMAKSVNRPHPVSGLRKCIKKQTRDYDPSFIVREDIKDHQGNIIARQGTSYNPLDTVSFGDPLIFIDGDDKDQVQWAISQKGKIVLINGTPLELRRDYKKDFYFDQGGVLVKKFGITDIPARVSQYQNKLLVEMIPVEKGES